MKHLEKRISELENRTAVNNPKFDIAKYNEGEVIRYNDQTFESESELKQYGKKRNIHILPVCIVTPNN